MSEYLAQGGVFVVAFGAVLLLVARVARPGFEFLATMARSFLGELRRMSTSMDELRDEVREMRAEQNARRRASADTPLASVGPPRRG